MAIGSKAEAVGRNMPEMMVKRTYGVSGVTGAEGTCLEKLRDTIALLASEWNFEEVPAGTDRDCLNGTLLKAARCCT